MVLAKKPKSTKWIIDNYSLQQLNPNSIESSMMFFQRSEGFDREPAQLEHICEIRRKLDEIDSIRKNLIRKGIIKEH